MHFPHSGRTLQHIYDINAYYLQLSIHQSALSLLSRSPHWVDWPPSKGVDHGRGTYSRFIESAAPLPGKNLHKDFCYYSNRFRHVGN